MSVRVWIPIADWEADVRALSADIAVDVFAGDPGETPPDSIDDVEVYVPPYLAGRPPYQLAARMPRLRVVQTLTAGIDNVRDLIPDGVTLCNARGVHDTSTAELAVALTLASLRGLPVFARAQERGEWAEGRYDALADKTVLIVGYGAIGAAVERRLAGFEVAQVLRVARRARPAGDGGAGGGQVAGMDALAQLLPRADVVILLVPMTDETRGLVDAGFLARMRDGALLVNVARGPVVRTDALLAELESGRLRAALDVTDPEPLPEGHPLWRAPGLLISPHVGGNTSAFEPRARRLVLDQLRRYLAGEPMHNVITGAY